MKQAIITAKETVELKEAAVPSLKENQVLVKVLACGLCTFEQRYYTGGKTDYPFHGGHEVCGVVEAIGASVKTDVKVGDKVVVACITRCGECYFCRRGQDNMCQHGGDEVVPGEPWGPGGLSEYLVAEGHQVYKIAPDVDVRIATLAEPLACVLRSFEKAFVRPGDTVLVTGGGVMGLLHLIVGRMLGLTVIVTEIDARRSKLLIEHGATAVLDPRDEDFVSKVMEQTNGLGVNAVLYTAGGKGAVEQAFRVIRKGGAIVLYGAIYPKALMEIDPNRIHYDEIILTGLVSTTKDSFEQAANLLSQQVLPLSALVSESYPFNEVARAFERSISPDTYRVVVVMDGEA